MYMHMCPYVCVCGTGGQTLAICILGKLCTTSAALVVVSVLLCVWNKTLLHVSA